MKKLILAFSLMIGVLTADNIYATSGLTIVSNEKKINSSKSAFSGRVVSETNEPLPGAMIIVSDIETGVFTDAQGYFYISNIPVGKHSVEVSYIGYSTVKEEIDFKASVVVDTEIIVTEGLEMGEVVVTGIVSGRKLAVQQQRAAMGVSNIVSADQMDRFPDENIGDAMKRIPGINVQYDQGEARFGQVRGTAPALSSVTVNGNRTPSAEGGTRSAQLDLIPADMIQTVEVRKVVTADMDGDAIGGAVNLVTKSAPSREILNVTSGVGYNPISQKATFNGSITAGKRFLDDKLGAVLAISYMNTPAGSDNIEGEWAQDDNGNAYLSVFENRQYFVHRERQSYSLSTDYKFNANNKIEFKAMYNRRNDWENRYKLKLKKMDGAESTATVSRQTKGGTEDERYTRLERQETQSYNLAGEHQISRLGIDWNIDYSTASELRPNERYITFEEKKVAIVQDLSDTRQPIISPVESGAFDLNNLGLDKMENSDQVIREHEIKASLNFKYDISNGAYANALRFGYKIQSKDKKMDIAYYDYEPTDSYADEFTALALSNSTNQSRSNYMAGDYAVGSFVNSEFLGNLNLNDAAKFDKEENYTEEAGNYTGKELINAGFIRFDQKLGKNLSAIAGVRLENTSYNYTRNVTNVDGELEVNGGLTNKRSVLNVLPSILFKYTPTEKIVARASFTSTIARPGFEDLIPGEIYDYNEEEIIVGNPDIKNMVSNNADLMFEYYTSGAGLLSAGVYYKSIKDFIVEASMKESIMDGDEELEFKRKQSINAGNGYLLGLEFALQQDLSFVSETFKNFGIYANYTYNHSKVTKLSDSPMIAGQTIDDLSLPGTPKNIVNASLYYENRVLSAAIAYNYASSYLDEMGDSQFENRYYDKTNYLDFNLSVKASSWLTIYGEVNNLLNQPLRYYQGEESRVMQLEYYGIRGSIGVKARF